MPAAATAQCATTVWPIQPGRALGPAIRTPARDAGGLAPPESGGRATCNQAFLTASLIRFCQALKRTAASLRFSWRAIRRTPCRPASFRSSFNSAGVQSTLFRRGRGMCKLRLIPDIDRADCQPAHSNSNILAPHPALVCLFVVPAFAASKFGARPATLGPILSAGALALRIRRAG